MSLYPDKFIGRAFDTIADATTWVTGTVFSYIKRIWTWLKAFATTATDEIVVHDASLFKDRGRR